MLKIKNNVDLKELTGYGFRILKDDSKLTPLDEDFYSNLAYKDLGHHFSIVIENDEWNRQITIVPNNDFPLKLCLTYQLDTLYDLIKDGLVEKVGE